MQFVIICHDIPNGFDKRQAARPAHLDYLKEQDAVVLAAGPFLDDEERMIGSLFIVDVADRAAAQAFSDNDPFTRQGILAHREIRRWRWGVKPPKA